MIMKPNTCFICGSLSAVGPSWDGSETLKSIGVR